MKTLSFVFAFLVYLVIYAAALMVTIGVPIALVTTVVVMTLWMLGVVS